MTNDRQIEIIPTPDARSSIPAPIPCPDCRGRGQVLLLTSTVPCIRCAATGFFPASPPDPGPDANPDQGDHEFPSHVLVNWGDLTTGDSADADDQNSEPRTTGDETVTGLVVWRNEPRR